MATSRNPTSPYQRYGKSPHLYSPVYQLWHTAVLNDGAGSQKALDLACKHAKYVGVRHNLPDGQKADDCVIETDHG